MKIEFDIELDNLSNFMKRVLVEDIELEDSFDNRDEIKQAYLYVLSNYTIRKEYEEITENLIEKEYITKEQADEANYWKILDLDEAVD